VDIDQDQSGCCDAIIPRGVLFLHHRDSVAMGGFDGLERVLSCRRDRRVGGIAILVKAAFHASVILRTPHPCNFLMGAERIVWPRGQDHGRVEKTRSPMNGSSRPSALFLTAMVSSPRCGLLRRSRGCDTATRCGSVFSAAFANGRPSRRQTAVNACASLAISSSL